MLYRLWLFILFLMCGVSIFVPIIFMMENIKTIYLISHPVLFLLAAVLIRRNAHLKKYFPVFFAFFVSSLAFSLSSLGPFSSGPGTTMESRVFNLLLSTLLVVISIVLLTKISGSDMASIYLKKGKFRLGLIIGLATFLFFLVTSVPAAIGLFGGREVTLEQLVAFAPWIAAFVFFNALREELWFRGLFLKKYETFLGVELSNFLQAILFSLAHFLWPFTLPFALIYLIITFFLGLGFGAVMQKTDSVLAAILFHAGVDIPVILSVFSVL